MDDAEHGGGRADAQREDQRHGRRKTGTALHAPQDVAKVASKVVEPAPAPDIAGVFPNQERVPERPLRRIQGSMVREACLPASLALERQMQPELRLEAFFGPTAPEVRYPSGKPRCPLHSLTSLTVRSQGQIAPARSLFRCRVYRSLPGISAPSARAVRHPSVHVSGTSRDQQRGAVSTHPPLKTRASPPAGPQGLSCTSRPPAGDSQSAR